MRLVYATGQGASTVNSVYSRALLEKFLVAPAMDR